jgi:hypothetical protein
MDYLLKGPLLAFNDNDFVFKTIGHQYLLDSIDSVQITYSYNHCSTIIAVPINLNRLLIRVVSDCITNPKLTSLDLYLKNICQIQK